MRMRFCSSGLDGFAPLMDVWKSGNDVARTFTALVALQTSCTPLQRFRNAVSFVVSYLDAMAEDGLSSLSARADFANLVNRCESRR